MNTRGRFQLGGRRQRGLTLVELMVSLVLSLVLMMGAIQLFSGSKETYRLSDSLAAIQENGRYALELLSRDIRQTGFTGCVSQPNLSNIVIHDPDVDWQFNFARPIFGYEGSDGEQSPSVAAAGAPGEPWGQADAIHVLFGDPNATMTITGPNSPTPSDPLEVAAGPVLESGQIMLVTDCRQAAVFRLTNDKGAGAGELRHAAGGAAPANCSDNLHDGCPPAADPTLLQPYLPDRSRALPLRVSSYFIGNTQRLMRNPQPQGVDDEFIPIPALYRQTLDPDALDGLGPIEELVEGISGLDITYGLAPAASPAGSSRSAERYLPADEVTDADAWDRVVSVRLVVSVRSVLGVRDDNAPDDLFQQTFSTTIALRNRTL